MSEGPQHIEGVIERITYQSEETGYTVAKLESKRRHLKPTTVVGHLAGIHPGETVRLEGYWATHPQYGRQFKIESYQVLYPATVEGIRKYLGSGMIKGIGPVTASRIVKHFGLDTLDIIETAPARLIEVPSMGRKRVGLIKRAWEEQKAVKEVMLFLQSHDVSTTHAVKIYKQYGDAAISLVRENPYRLERDIWGIGFLTADQIAQKLGMDVDAPERVQAGARYVLNQYSEQGHLFVPREELASKASEALGVDPAQVAVGIKDLAIEEGVIVEPGPVEEEDRVYLPPLYYAELGAANALRRLMQRPLRHEMAVDRELSSLEGRMGIEFADAQRDAIRTACEQKAVVITGGPGTGKTTITRGILELFELRGQRILLCSPTGRAAKRLSEATRRPAKTIHRMLGFNPAKGGFQKDRDDPLEVDLVIVDEVSMIDTVLMHNLLKAIPETSRLVLVGDVDQLPSVGPGNVLRDIIASEEVPVVRLTHIFRQARTSQIVTSAHRINQGEYPEVDNKTAREFFFIEQKDPEVIPELIEKLCTERIPRRLHCDPIDDIQVIAPMYRGSTGATHLNARLQHALNPDGFAYRRGNTEYRAGDKVMQVRNNYQKLVFNGDIGRIRSIDIEEQQLLVQFDEPVLYEFHELDELVPAYAISVHKAQGSEYPAVVMPVTMQHYLLLQRNLLYTAVTRAKQLVVLIGAPKALWIAVRNAKVAERYTSLADRLRPNPRSPFPTREGGTGE